MESENLSFQLPVAYPEPSAEHRTCFIKLHEIHGMLSNSISLSFSELELLNREVDSRLTHLHQRILRLPPHMQCDLIKLLVVVKEAQSRVKRSAEASSVFDLIGFADTFPAPTQPSAEFLERPNINDADYRDLISRLNSMQCTTAVETTPTQARSYPLPQPQCTTFNHPNVQFHTPVQTNHPSSTMLPPTDPKVHVGRWNITFDGSSGFNEFLEHIQEAAFARNVSHDQLFRQATDLFTGNAIIWFRIIRSNIHSWSELTSRLRNTFLPANYDLALQQEIRSRTQGPSEKSYKKSLQHPKAHPEVRTAFQEKLRKYQNEGRPVVCTDESGFAQDMPRKHGHAKQGKRYFSRHAWGERGRINVIGALLGATLLTVRMVLWVQAPFSGQ